ncbi:MAG: hypothetical protein IT337_15225 [Thermomicrobiales bacterium]|nr:hypothetical protein [Thermomicrobiales bacterium]
MPFFEPEETPGLRAAEQAVPPVRPDVTGLDLMGAAFRQDNTVVNLFRRAMEPWSVPDPSHNPLLLIRGTKYEQQHLRRFVDSRSAYDTFAIMRRIDEEEADRRILDAAGFPGFVAQVAAGTIDPTIALPGGAVYRGVRGGYSLLRSAASVGAAAGAATAVQEGVLQAAQETRTATESALAVGSATILGGLIGTGAARLLSRAEEAVLVRAIDRARADIDTHAAAGAPREAGQYSILRADDPGGIPNYFVVRQDSPFASGDLTPQRRAELMASGDLIAEARVRLGDGEANVSNVQVDPGFRRQGVATALYDAIDQEMAAAGRALRPDSYLSADAWAFWQRRAPHLLAGYEPRPGGAFERPAVEAPPLAPGAVVSPGTVPAMASAGAAAADTRSLNLVRTGLEFTGRLSPTRRLLQVESVEARRIAVDLAETPYRFEGGEGPNGPALDRIARMAVLGTRWQVQDEMNRLYADYRFGDADIRLPNVRAEIARFTGATEGKMSPGDFRREVSRALNENDQHDVPQVQQAAQVIRQRVFEPWKRRAIEAGIFTEDVGADAAESYFTRLWNKEAIRARRPEFVNVVLDWLRTDQEAKAAAKQRLATLNDDLAQARKSLDGAKTPEAAAEAQIRHDDLRARIEAEIGAWQGTSAAEAKSALKAREKYARETGRAADEPRLTSADTAIDKAVRRIIESDRDLSVEELRDRAQEVTDRILGSPDGRLPYDVHMGGPRIGFHDGPAPRGPLAARNFAIPNAMVREFIEDDAEQVVATYLRTVVPDVLLTERFGDVEMSPAFRRINEDYARRIDTTRAEADRTRLGKERDAAIRDLAAIRDRIRGVYGWSADMQNAARLVAAAKTVNNLTSMGVAAVSSLPDLAGIVFRHGLATTFRDGWAPFFRHLAGSEGWSRSQRQWRAVGLAVETATAARQHLIDDVSDVYRPGTRFERGLQFATDKFFVANLLAPFTDFAKTAAANVSASEILRAAEAVVAGKATKRQLDNLRESAIDIQMAGRIWEEFGVRGRGETIDGVRLPNTADWTDRQAAQAFEAAVARETEIAVVTPGQEKPLWMSKPVVGLFGQFKSFTASATERVLIANLQRRDANVLSGLLFSLSLGMLSYKLQEVFGGHKTSDKPADWIKEGISRAGMLGWFEEGNALATKATRGSVDIYRLIGSTKPLSRYASRNAADMLLGPTAGKMQSVFQVTGAAATGDWSAADTSALRRMTALQNVFWLRGLLNKVEAGVNAKLGIE